MHEPLLDACRKGERSAQRALYDLYKGKMFALCLRYADNRQDAEDWLQEGFVKVFRDLHQYTAQGNFEGWMRKLMLRTVLENLRRQKHLLSVVEMARAEEVENEELPDTEEDVSLARYLLQLMQQLPSGFRTVLNLYILEGWTHPEIAAELGITVSTSKSQLLRAKAALRTLLEKNLIIHLP